MNNYETTGAPINLHWHGSIDLSEINYNKKHSCIKELPDTTGIYIFWRKHGDTHECLYIGRTSRLKTRLIEQLNDRELINHVQNAKKGTKILSFAEIKMHGNSYIDDYLDKVETFFISEALSQGHNLYNKQKTKFCGNEITSHGKTYPNIIEKIMYMPNK
ncbi:hypothetical protein KKI90_13640 [Xenorhabdus bovienii]|uniref:hypothetical protein n=1 Tax=Xenorhabdus bovienii TaxID=40576 RepID=UPI00237CCC8E|nr:hypothetical protein [Xenorhabdus bovienii]MDE1487421.1 hypothetical protein [Xenorhabdus bovienii]MDE9480011.1 hypothetical protein [Xenorhabdus bovienii]MDE9532958.1 hypothetical protein [Xenorhabdus bovienii]